MPKMTIADFLPPELVARMEATNSKTDDLKDIYTLTDDALFEVGKVYTATLGAEAENPGAYTEMLAHLRQAILQGVVAWARARAVLGPIKR
jgi:hypothetical protein